MSSSVLINDKNNFKSKGAVIRLKKDIVPIASFRDKTDRTKFIVHFEEPISYIKTNKTADRSIENKPSKLDKDLAVKTLTEKTNQQFERSNTLCLR